jgi:hypothetical protein
VAIEPAKLCDFGHACRHTPILRNVRNAAGFCLLSNESLAWLLSIGTPNAVAHLVLSINALLAGRVIADLRELACTEPAAPRR